MKVDAAPPVAIQGPVPGFRPLGRASCLELLDHARFGRMAMANGVTPALMPVRVIAAEGTVRLEMSPQAAPLPDNEGMVAVEVDQIDPGGSWSVIVTGPASAQPRGLVLDLSAASISGRVVTPTRPGMPGPVPTVLPAPGVIPPDRAFRLLAHHVIGYLAVTAGQTPHIFPVNYALDSDTVVFRTGTGTKLHALSRSLVAFQVDQLMPDGSGWSVLLEGLAEELTSADPEAVRARAATLALEPWAPGDRPYFVRVVPLRVHGISHRWPLERALAPRSGR